MLQLLRTLETWLRGHVRKPKESDTHSAPKKGQEDQQKLRLKWGTSITKTLTGRLPSVAKHFQHNTAAVQRGDEGHFFFFFWARGSRERRVSRS